MYTDKGLVYVKKVRKIRHKTVFYIAALLFVLSSTLVSAVHTPLSQNIAKGIDIAGILIGIAVLVFIISTLKSFKHTLRKSFDYILYGVIFQLLALVYTLLFLRFKLYPVPIDTDLHHLLMVIGFVFFAIAAYNLRKMLIELK